MMTNYLTVDQVRIRTVLPTLTVSWRTRLLSVPMNSTRMKNMSPAGLYESPWTLPTPVKITVMFAGQVSLKSLDIF